MSRSKSLILTLALWISLTMCPQVVCGQNGKEEAGVTIELTKLDVNDTNLDLSWKIRNNTDHDVWICDGWGVKPAAGKLASEVYMAKDAQTLVITRRFDLPLRKGVIWEFPLRSRYVRLRSGEDKVESISLILPIRPYHIFEGESGNAEQASCLALEISFFNEDLPGLILHIVEVAKKLSCVDLAAADLNLNDTEIFERYFGGFAIKSDFNSDAYFSESINEGGEQVIIPYMRQVLNCEQVLRLEVDGVCIPYGSAPAADEPANDKVEDTPITLALTKLDVNDTNLDLSYKIINYSDHDVWILKSVDALNSGFEVYVAEDNQTLLICRRLNVPTFMTWFVVPTGRYVRLQPGEELAETLSLTLPIRQNWVFSFPGSKAEYAKRLALEIGFYDKDLPGMMRTILEFADELDWKEKLGVIVEGHTVIRERYFKGLYLALDFNGLWGFNKNYYTEPNQVKINYSEQCMTDEQTLRVAVDGVFIPVKEWQFPTYQSQKELRDKQSNQSSSLNR